MQVGVLGAGLTLLAAWPFDMASRRVPNVLVVTSAVTALGVALYQGQSALATALTWGALGLGLGFGLWKVGVWGAGDGKLCAALGLWLGPPGLLAAALSFPVAATYLVFQAQRRGDLKGFATRVARRLAADVRRLAQARAFPGPGAGDQARDGQETEGDAAGVPSHVPFVGFFFGALLIVAILDSAGALWGR